MPLAYFDHHTIGRLMTRTIHDVDQINQMFAESVIPIIGNIFLFIGIFLAVLIIDWKIAILMLIILPFVWILTSRFRKFQRICYDRIRTVVAAMNTFVQENLMGASIIRNFGLQSQSKNEFEEINEDYCNAYVDSIHHFSFFIAGVDLLQNTSLILAFVVIVLSVPLGIGFEVGTFITFSLFCLMFFRPLADLAERYNVLQSAMAAAARIFSLLDTPSEKQMDKGTIELTEVESIAFEDVWFSYEKDNWVLKGISFEVHKGQSYAIVGMTGEGKSTIMSLLLRFYEPQKGKIIINGRDVRDYTLASLRGQFSLVLQDPVIFSGTIAENIALFDNSLKQNEIESAVDDLGMRSLIDHYPKGIDHILNERGKGLSTGEMQLISLARAIACRRSVLILDEATANVDTSTEQMMQHALHKVLKKQTALVIAHRLSTVKDAAGIIVLQGGKVAEIGTHQVLLDKKGVYEKLYRLQFAT
jgi:ATP-binding cassette subfamily B protein